MKARSKACRVKRRHTDVEINRRISLMKVNKDQLKKLAELPDDKLWAEIVRMGEGYGITMPKATPPHSQLEKLRSTVNGTKLNIGEAVKILTEYKKGGK